MKLSVLANLGRLIPELLVVITMVGALLMEATYKVEEKKRTFTYTWALIGLVVTFVTILFSLGHQNELIFTSSYAVDSFSSFAKLVMALGGISVLYLGYTSSDLHHSNRSEFVALVLGTVVGGMLLSSANNLLNMYLGVETLSILSYVLASLNKTNTKSSEAGVKYVLYGGLAAGIMLFGMAHLYGLFGSIHFDAISQKAGMLTSDQFPLFVVAFLLFFVGLGYKIASVPFHMWSPDVYEGSPLPVTAFFAIVPKLAGMCALVRIGQVFFSSPGDLKEFWVTLIHLIAILTMFVGNITAIGQRSLKRMLAYSSIAHAGTMLLGVVVLSEDGAHAILFYALSYVFMTAVSFGVISFINDNYGNDHIDRLNGMIYRHPLISICFMVALLSLGGIPPFVGFVAKFSVIYAVVQKGYYFLALMAVINSVISLYYYLKPLRLMVFEAPESKGKIPTFTISSSLYVIGVAVPILFLGLCWNKIVHIIGDTGLF